MAVTVEKLYWSDKVGVTVFVSPLNMCPPMQVFPAAGLTATVNNTIPCGGNVGHVYYLTYVYLIMS